MISNNEAQLVNGGELNDDPSPIVNLNNAVVALKDKPCPVVKPNNAEAISERAIQMKPFQDPLVEQKARTLLPGLEQQNDKYLQVCVQDGYNGPIYCKN